VTGTSAPVRRSVEVEYWVIDDDGRLTDPGELVDLPGAEREFVEPVLEIKTTPCETTDGLREELFDRVGRVVKRGREVGRHLVPLATPLCEANVRELPSERTRIQNLVVGDDFRYVRYCAGTHVHLEQRPGHEVDQFNALVALDPALALLNSAPYYDGERLADGARSLLYRRMAYRDLPHQGRLWSYIEDTAEWTRRLERRYEEFVTAALDAGVDRRTVEANFDPESAVWTPVQFREAFGTVEWRSPDAALPSQVIEMADTLARVVGHIDAAEVRIEGSEGFITDHEVVLPEFDSVLGYLDAAIDDGLGSRAVRTYLDRMGFRVNEFEPVSGEMAGEGPLDGETARRLRLEHARRLESDLGRLRPVRGD
jgi:hypothetical protein